jgi:hypothetical protein
VVKAEQAVALQFYERLSHRIASMGSTQQTRILRQANQRLA